MNSEPHIKIIPPNPFINSILIVYCHFNNKTLQCQAKWTRLQSLITQNLQNRNSRNQMNIQNGNTYKCTPLDYNHVIQVQAVCDYMGKQFKLSARTEIVKITKQLQQRKSQSKWIRCKILNSSQSIQCQINLEMNKVLQLIIGTKQFNLQLNPSYVNVISTNSFKTSIHIHRYQFLTFFQDSLLNKQTNQPSLSLCNTFEFIFNNEFDRDLTLLKIAQNNTIIKQQNIQNNNNNKLLLTINDKPSLFLNKQLNLNQINQNNNNLYQQYQQNQYQQLQQYQSQNNIQTSIIPINQQNSSNNLHINIKNNNKFNNNLTPNNSNNNNNNNNAIKLQIKSNHKNQFNGDTNNLNTLQLNQNNLQDNNKIKTKRSINQLKKHNNSHNNTNNQIIKTAQNSKRQGVNKSKTPDPKFINNIFYQDLLLSPTTNNNSNNNNSARKKIQKDNNNKIKITQKLIKKGQIQKQLSILSDKKLNNHNQNHQFKIKEQEVFIINNHNNFTPNNIQNKKNHVLKKDSNQQFLNIFDQDDAPISEPENHQMQNSSPEFFVDDINKNRPVTNYKQNQVKQIKQDLPSINLRGSFQQLQKYVPVADFGSNKKIKQKLKTQINRGNFSYQYPKNRQKTQISQKQIQKSPAHQQQIQQNQQHNQTKQQLFQLKKQNTQIRKQLQNMYIIIKENNSLKKKYYQLNEQVNRLQMQRKQILSDKLKCQANYHKQKIQKQQLKNQLQDLLKMLESGNFIINNNQYSGNNNNTGTITPNNSINFNNSYSNSGLLLNNNLYNQNQFNDNNNNSSLSYQQNRKKIHNIIPNPLLLKKIYLNQLKQKNIISNKTISSNHSIMDNIQKQKTFDSNTPSNTQSRKQLKFNTYNYKYGNPITNINNK